MHPCYANVLYVGLKLESRVQTWRLYLEKGALSELHGPAQMVFVGIWETVSRVNNRRKHIKPNMKNYSNHNENTD